MISPKKILAAMKRMDTIVRQDIIDRPENALVEVVLMKSVKEIEEMGWNTFLSRIP